MIGARQRSSCGSRERRRATSKTKLVDLGATTLNQNNQHDDEEQARHDANQSGAIHGESSFFAASMRYIRKFVSDLATLGSGCTRVAGSGLNWWLAGHLVSEGPARRSAQTSLS